MDDGKKGRGRPHKRWSQYITEWMGTSNNQKWKENRETYQATVRDVVSRKECQPRERVFAAIRV